jgi:hypothetical protein
MAGRGKLGKSSTAGERVASGHQHVWTRLMKLRKPAFIPSFSTNAQELRQFVTSYIKRGNCVFIVFGQTVGE